MMIRMRWEREIKMSKRDRNVIGGLLPERLTHSQGGMPGLPELAFS